MGNQIQKAFRYQIACTVVPWIPEQSPVTDWIILLIHMGWRLFCELSMKVHHSLFPPNFNFHEQYLFISYLAFLH